MDSVLSEHLLGEGHDDDDDDNNNDDGRGEGAMYSRLSNYDEGIEGDGDPYVESHRSMELWL